MMNIRDITPQFLGNSLSDLVTRLAPAGAFRPGPSITQVCVADGMKLNLMRSRHMRNDA